ncbi:hypothetical protein Sarmat_00578 [Rickettsiales endosymbiont of Paramecium tredecaurelia]|nr:hypothetical protein [Candidatus Sarmatiella mevalonica]
MSVSTNAAIKARAEFAKKLSRKYDEFRTSR